VELNVAGGALIPFAGKAPLVDPAAFVAPGARLIGDVEVGPEASIWYNCVLRGDVNRIRIGARANIQDGTIVHCDSPRPGSPEGHPTLIGEDVLIGHMAMVHGCILRDRAFVGLGAIAITDHNAFGGALEARELARGRDLVVIPGEEIKTDGQGEIIGLFLEREIPRGMSFADTVGAIREQGGLVYVPHPFDRMHAVPDYEHLLDVVGDIDAIEVFNPRVAFSAFNEEAARFAAKYRIAAGAGSDSHVAQGLGAVMIRMRDFDGPQEFLESLREADIVRRRQSLLYVQALKFIQTKATPEPARKRTARPGAGAARNARGPAASREAGAPGASNK
jgi:hypothetical protein